MRLDGLYNTLGMVSVRGRKKLRNGVTGSERDALVRDREGFMGIDVAAAAQEVQASWN